MRIIRSQSSIKSFYSNVIKSQTPTEENLFGAISRSFQNLLTNYVNSNGLRAIDLGYGYGNYSIALAEKGFEVISVDYLNADYFKNRLKELSISEKITVLEEDLNLFSLKPKDRYDFVVSKDVFHFLAQSKVEQLLHDLVRKTNKGGCHYIVIFTDIQRKSKDGNEILIENEAKFSTSYLIKWISSLYSNWKFTIEVEEYKERDRSGKKDSFYFTAKRLTIIANYI
jgi:cyclopropane fatty-acyl-phospholipid synthase-like methyltransferase